MTPIQIRRTERNDGALVRQLRIAALTDAPHAFGARLEDVLALPASAFDEVADRHCTSDLSTSFILLAGFGPAGTVGAFLQPGSRFDAFICSLWVDPRVRGTEAARCLTRAAVDWLTARNAAECFAWVADSNVRAISFYK